MVERNWSEEYASRVKWIRAQLEASGARGLVYGNSGGKDSALVGILCKAACSDTLGLIMPCSSKRNYSMDMEDGLAVAAQYQIETRTIDLTAVREQELAALGGAAKVSELAAANIAPRLRMTTLYAVAASEDRLVAGTGNRSEAYMGYFTKWGDGAYDFNPIGDLTVTEIFAFLRYLGAPRQIIEKAPSAGLFDGQTDEEEMGVSYRAIDEWLLDGSGTEPDLAVMRRFHEKSEHKRRPIPVYGRE
ncbi:MAG: NAD(+) synthase [Oscillospiraceae bacterium]|nr:NAD(+) synthase [Oscillospiraceae bacterium]